MRYYKLPPLLSIATAFAVCSVATSPGLADNAPTPSVTSQVDLRGYGRVSASFGPNSASFQCSDVTHADIVLGKMLADLFWDAKDTVTQRTITVDGTSVIVHAWAGYGEITVARIGTRVMAFGAADDQALSILLKSHPEFLHGSPTFVPQKPYPRYLDHYDLRSYKAYTGAMASSHNFSLDSHWQFIKKFGMGGMAFQSLSISNSNPAPGVISFVQSDYEMRTANQNDGVATIGLGTGGHIPLWISNTIPDAIMRPSPTTLLGSWNGTAPIGASYESWWLSAEKRAEGSLLFARQAMERYKDNPALSGWHLYTGAPGAEFGFHDRGGQFWDYSPTGEVAFRTWLRNTRKFSLAQLGQRWYGDAAHFKTWGQVQLPDVNAFFGGTDSSSVRLVNGWQYASARDGVANPPAKSDPAWMPVEMPPSEKEALLPWGEAFYRIEFDGAQWVSRPQVWLACNVLAHSVNKTNVWLNGEQIASVPSDKRAFAVAMAGKVKLGINDLILRVPRQAAETPGSNFFREGKIFGPIYLTASEPKPYPYLGTYANARYVDLRDWQSAGLSASHRAMLDMALAIDPDHPFTLSGSAMEANNVITDLAEDYGTSCQHTGREAWYHPWWAGVGMLGGFYGTSEESGTTSAVGLTRELGWMMLDGDSNHNLFHSIDEYQIEEQKSGWFTKNQRAIQCFGKYLRAMPQIAILRSGRNILLGSQEPLAWDIGRGELQTLHFDNAYATETELVKGLTDACPVLLDAGTEIMDDDVIQGLQRYIERGGVYIALQQTGRHTSITQDAQPLSRLTGLIARSHDQGSLSFVAGSSLFADWAGRKFTGDGIALTPAPSGMVVPGGVPVAVARWDDGSIAISVRQIGKGRIIQIGSPFWRDENADKPDTVPASVEAAFIGHLLTDLGVRRNADASDSGIWTRKATTKNGLQDWLLTYNASDAPRTADVRLAVDEKPAQVWDLLTGQPVASTYADGFVTIPNVSYETRAIHFFAVKRADLVDGLSFWWGEKTRYWKRPPAASSPEVAIARTRLATPAISTKTTAAIPFSKWHFLADRDGSVGTQDKWMRAGFDDVKWRLMENGPWNLSDAALSDWSGTGLYRKTFTVPASWQGRRIILNLFDWDRPIVYDQGTFFVNGTKVADYQAHAWSQKYAYDVTSLLHSGSNVLSVNVQGGKLFSGICGSVWLAPEERVLSQVSLLGPWQIVKGDLRTHEPVQLPGKPTGRYLEREIDIPKNWIGKTTYLHVETDQQWVACIVVNGHLITTNGAMHPFSPRLEVNITPYLVAGQNQIQLWPYGVVPNLWQSETTELPLPVLAARLETIVAEKK